MDNFTDEELMEKAVQAMADAYSPYSNFKVGAAILTEDGRAFTGCNVENSSYGASICAERTAAVKAVSNRALKFKKIAVVSSSGEFTYPCGICRQFLSEFADENTEYIFGKSGGEIKSAKAAEFLPYAFTKESIK